MIIKAGATNETSLHCFVRDILETCHSSSVLNLNIFYSASFPNFLKVRGWKERAQRELSNEPIKSHFK